MSLIKNARAGRIVKWGGLLLAVIVVVAGISFGPTLLGVYRFMESVDAASKESTATAGAWPRLQEVCMPCHGTNGNPVSQQYARLAGQPQTYLVRQLTAFASGERPNPTMSPLALDLSADKINRLAAFFAAQPVKANAPFAADPARVKNGEMLAKTANCAACHGPGMQGLDSNPRLAGQGSIYLANQLRDFKSGTRRDPQGVMAAIDTRLSDEDIANLSQYLATITKQAHE